MDTPAVHPDELSNAAGRPCPRELPVGEDPSGHGFGAQEVAKEVPTLLAPHEAWVCRYDAFDAGRTAGGGAILGWRRAGGPEPVAAADIPDLHDALEELAPGEPNRMCTSDLGPRWLVVLGHDGDLTGVLVDDYGCRDVRLTENPTTTPPGAAEQDGTVSGVLAGGGAILAVLGLGLSS